MVGQVLRLLAAVLVVNGLLLSAQWFFPAEVGAPWFALEAGFVVGLALLLPRTRGSWLAGLVLAVSVVCMTVLAFSEAAARIILARPLNLYLDFPLAGSIIDLLVGTLGPLPTIGVVAVAALVLAVTVGLVTILLTERAHPSSASLAWTVEGAGRATGWPRRLLAGGLMTPLAVWLVASMGTVAQLPVLSLRLATPAVDIIRVQTTRLRETLTERDRFEEDLAANPADYGGMTGLLRGLENRDVVLAFIESYGMSVVDDPRYAPVIVPRLEELDRRMADAGLSIASGTLVAPTQGGQSWFSHGSLLSGLWLDNQLRYDLMLGSGRETLIDDFRSAGYRTVALMPAITFAWPEGERFRYDEVFARSDISYEGPPLNWVTMPDQFSWSFLERNIRGGGAPAASERLDRRPVFVEVSLISSHAPWTPILPVLDDWESIGDGQVFSKWADAGERPEELWLDTERVREQFALSVGYAVSAMTAYAERYVDDSLLLIVLGDHQPAPLITGEDVSLEVPVHVISRDPKLIEPFLEWGFERGGLPSRAYPDRGMDSFRRWFVEAYSSAGTSPISGSMNP